MTIIEFVISYTWAGNEKEYRTEDLPDAQRFLVNLNIRSEDYISSHGVCILDNIELKVRLIDKS